MANCARLNSGSIHTELRISKTNNKGFCLRTKALLIGVKNDSTRNNERPLFYGGYDGL